MSAAAGSIEPFISIKGLTTQFRISRTLFDRHPLVLRAVNDVSLDIGEGSIVGLVGESGSGKTTFARTLSRLEPATSGSAKLAGKEFIQVSDAAFHPFRRKIQMIFQDPYGSLNPRKRVGTIVADGLRIHGIGNRAERRATVATLLQKVGLPSDTASRFPHEFSGGQRQRIGIARALAVDPQFIIADEPVSALDVSIQAQILNLLIRIKREFRLAILLISHDLGVVRAVSDFVAVMYLGRVVESAPTRTLFNEPRHPYTKALLSAFPVADPRRRRASQPLAGDVPSPFSPPSGCTFRTRCPFAKRECAEIVPEARLVGAGHTVACIRDDLD